MRTATVGRRSRGADSARSVTSDVEPDVRDPPERHGEAVRAIVAALIYDDRVTANSFPPVVLRNGVAIEDPLSVVLGFLRAPRRSTSATLRSRRRSASRTSGWRTGPAPASQRPRPRRSWNGAARSSKPYRRSLPMLRWQERRTQCRGCRSGSSSTRSRASGGPAFRR